MDRGAALILEVVALVLTMATAAEAIRREPQAWSLYLEPSTSPSPSALPPSQPDDKPCVPLWEMTEGPYWVEENIEASNIRSELPDGVPLNITFKVVDGGQPSPVTGGCVPMGFARVDIWHCSYDGKYSDVADEGTEGQKWLRGYQFTNSSGYATFYTIFPGWYVSRTVHIHVRVRTYGFDGETTLYEDTTQLYFDDSISDAIYSNVYPYNDRGQERDTYNNADPLFTTANLITLEGSYNDSNGYTSYVEFSLPLSSSSTKI